MAAILSPKDLAELLEKDNKVVLLQAAINPQGGAAFRESRIAGAKLFEVGVCSDPESPFIFTIPSQQQFQDYVNKLGVRKDSHVVVYDAAPPFVASARVWWMFRLFGHDQVSVLSGGLNLWKEEGHAIDSSDPVDDVQTSAVANDDSFCAILNPNLLKSLADVTSNIQDNQFQLIDGRPKGMFDECSIPGAKNVSFLDVIDDKKRVKAKEDLASLFQQAGVDLQLPTVAHCITGVTACSVALAAYICGKQDVAIYDGSWNEWKANN